MEGVPGGFDSEGAPAGGGGQCLCLAVCLVRHRYPDDVQLVFESETTSVPFYQILFSTRPSQSGESANDQSDSRNAFLFAAGDRQLPEGAFPGAKLRHPEGNRL